MENNPDNVYTYMCTQVPACGCCPSFFLSLLSSLSLIRVMCSRLNHPSQLALFGRLGSFCFSSGQHLHWLAKELKYEGLHPSKGTNHIIQTTGLMTALSLASNSSNSKIQNGPLFPQQQLASRLVLMSWSLWWRTLTICLDASANHSELDHKDY